MAVVCVTHPVHTPARSFAVSRCLVIFFELPAGPELPESPELIGFFVTSCDVFFSTARQLASPCCKNDDVSFWVQLPGDVLSGQRVAICAPSETPKKESSLGRR